MATELQKSQDVAGEVETAIADKDIVPMSMPMQKLEVKEIPGYVLYWMKGTPDRIGRAHRAGYRFVEPHETELNNFDLAGDAKSDGNTDLGNSRVSVVAGGEIGADGQPVRLYLMKIKKEHYEKSMALTAQKSEMIAASIRGGTIGAGEAAGENAYDAAQRYARGASAAPAKPRNMFDAKT